MFGSAVSKVGSAASKVATAVHLPGTTKKDSAFSEAEAFKHLKAFTDIASHPASSDKSPLLQYVLDQSESIKKAAEGEVKVEVDRVPGKSGDSVLLKVLPKNVSKAEKHHAILVSAHVDSVFSGEGASDDTSNVAIMLELARGLSQSSNGPNSSVIFLFNTEEEEGLDGVHHFITQHSFGNTVRLAIDLDSFGSTLTSSTSEATGSKNPVLFMSRIGEEGIVTAEQLMFDLKGFSSYPPGFIAAQDLFHAGIINPATDFKVYKEAPGMPGLDFAFRDNTTVYHTKNDKLELLKPGSLQHLGENMLVFLLQVDPVS